MQSIPKFMWWLLWLLIGSNLQAQSPSDLATIGQGTHLYLRCNSTEWGVTEQNRLKPASPNFLRELSFEVKESWMLDSGDDCVITETPKLNAWGDWQKDYGARSYSMKAPDSSRLRLPQATDETMNFKMRFPALGRYRLTLNTRDGYFSIKKDAPTVAGDVDWTLPGNMTSDKFGHFFLYGYSPQNSLSMVNPRTGLPIWTYNSASYLSFSNACSTVDRAFMTLSDRVIALSLKTGKELWSNDLAGALKDNYAYLNCSTNSQELLLTYGSDQTKVASLNRTTGQVNWNWQAGAYAGILGTDAKNVYIRSYKDSNSTVLALGKGSGIELWRSTQNAGYTNIAEDGNLYRINSQSVGRIDPETGKDLWTYSGRTDDYVWLSFEHNRLYLHEQNRLHSLDKKTGQFLWTYDFSSFASQYPYAQILQADVILIRINNYSEDWSKQIGLSGATGRQIWESESKNTNGYLAEDNQGGTWLIDGKTIASLDPMNGNRLWSFNLASDKPWENLMGVIERDGSNLYVSYGLTGSKYPPMGVLALDVGTGRLNWQSWLDSTAYIVGADNGHLVMNAGYYGSVKALKK